MLNREDRKQFKMIAPIDLEEYLDKNPPGGILAGHDLDLEMPFIQYGIDHSYKEADFPGVYNLWTR